MYLEWNHRLRSGVSEAKENPAQQKAQVGLLVIFQRVHQDSRHPAILSKCTASESLQSLQSSDELKMYAWVGNIFGVHHNNNLKGKQNKVGWY